MVVFGLSGCIRAKWLYWGKMVIFAQKLLFSGKSGCNWAKVVVFGQTLLFLGKVIVFRQTCCFRLRWLYSGKWLYSGTNLVFG